MSLNTTAQAALEALDMLCTGLEWNIENHPTVMNQSDDEALATAKDAADALRLELGKPAQKPVCWANVNKHGDVTHHANKCMPWAKTPLYAHPAEQPQQRPKTTTPLEQAAQAVFDAYTSTGTLHVETVQRMGPSVRELAEVLDGIVRPRQEPATASPVDMKVYDAIASNHKEARIDYGIVYELASKWKLDYNMLCALIRDYHRGL